jgi:hypothetical protein
VTTAYIAGELGKALCRTRTDDPSAAGMLEAERQFRRVIGHGDVGSSPTRSNCV